MNNTFLTISLESFYQSNSIQPFLYTAQTPSNHPIILSDFDGTISHQDVTDTLLEHFGMPGYEELEEQWLADKISSRECMSKQIALMDTSLPELNKILDTITIDPAFIDLVHYANHHNITVKVVSDGLDYPIEYILKKHGINLPIYANSLLHNSQRSWRLAFPYADTHCVKASGNCKCTLVKQHQKIAKSIIYIGDGASDFCVANKVDIVLAKNKLINYCREKQIAYRAINDFSDVISQLPAIYQDKQDKISPITLLD